MVKKEVERIITTVIAEQQTVTMDELCRDCGLAAEQVINLIDYGIIEPLEPRESSTHWEFSGKSVVIVQTVIRLQRDLDVNLPGAVLAVELLEEVEKLRQQVDALKRQ